MGPMEHNSDEKKSMALAWHEVALYPQWLFSILGAKVHLQNWLDRTK